MNTLPADLDRARDIDVAKGIAIALVVLGHVVARDIRPLGNDWYVTMNRLLYTFHMAFFFFLSGYVYFLRSDNDCCQSWPNECSSRGLAG